MVRSPSSFSDEPVQYNQARVYLEQAFYSFKLVKYLSRYKDLTAGQLCDRAISIPFVGRSGAVFFHFYKKMASKANQLLCFLLLLVVNVMPVTGRR